jgi:beta-alanine degradation protein BauB
MPHRIVEIAPPGPPSDPRRDWPQALRDEFDRNQFRGEVGNVLVSETERVRVWHLTLPPGGMITFHRHVLDYFWTTHTPGVARGYYEDGRIVDVHHYPGETRHFTHGPGEYFVHAIENVGETELFFVTVEFLDSGNPPIPIGDESRLAPQEPTA